MPKVSVVIVCMNNLNNLYPCVESVMEQNRVSMEIIVVCYLFSKENLAKVKADFPSVSFIESNETRGFSENNNLALRHIHGKFCLILNDDTEMRMPVIDDLVSTMESLPHKVAVVSPKFVNEDGSLQSNGRPPYPLYSYFFHYFGLKVGSKWEKLYTNRAGVYKSYNLSGACFLIKTDIFRSLNWFDERYFFCPEDIALSTILNNIGYDCYVNADAKIIHKGARSSSSIIQVAIAPAKERGTRIFYCESSVLKNIFFIFMSWFIHISYVLFWFVKYRMGGDLSSKIKCRCHFNIVLSIASRKTPKDVFIDFYSKI